MKRTSTSMKDKVCVNMKGLGRKREEVLFFRLRH